MRDEELVHTSPLSEWIGERDFSLRWTHLLACLAISALFIYMNNMRMFHTDLWGHVSYGDWILEQGKLPQEDPFLHLAEGVPVIDSAWLSQVALSSAARLCGHEGLSGLFAILSTASYLMLGIAFFMRSNRIGLAAVGAFLVLMFGATRIAIIRTENFGFVNFAMVVLAIALLERGPGAVNDKESDRPMLWKNWLALIVVPILFTLWANLHGSFVVGLAFVGARVPGRFIDVLLRTKSIVRPLLDRQFRYWLVLTELCFAAVLINPYGLDLVINAFAFPNNPNLADVLEWKKLPLVSAEGILFSISWVMLLVTIRHSRTPIKAADIILLAVFNFAVVMSVRMIGWYAVVFTYVLIPHLAELLSRFWPIRSDDPESESLIVRLRRPSLGYTAACALLLWCGFALSPSGHVVLGGEPRESSRLYSEMTPHGLTKYLREHPPQGQVFNPQWWGDWLIYDGPAGIRPFMTTNAVHVAPNRVWNDYMRVAQARVGWQNVLDRYRVELAIAHKELQPTLADRIRTLPGWKIAYEDDLAIVMTRGDALDADSSPSSL